MQDRKDEIEKKPLLSMRESMDRIVNKIKSIFHEKCGIDKLNVVELLGKEKWGLYLFLIICLFWVQLFARPVRRVQAEIKYNDSKPFQYTAVFSFLAL